MKGMLQAFADQGKLTAVESFSVGGFKLPITFRAAQWYRMIFDVLG